MIRIFPVGLATVLALAGCAQTRPQAQKQSAAMLPNLPHNPAPRMVVKSPKLPSIFIAGDSTASRGSEVWHQGWAVPFANYFDPSKVNVVNCARGGRSSRTFVTEGLWAKLLAQVKPGDIVLIQFGHNDAGLINDRRRARGSLPGLGDQTEAITNLETGKFEIVHTYGWYMRKMIDDVKARHATPIVLTLTVRDIWHHGRIERGPGSYSPWAAEVAWSQHALFADLTDLMANKFEAMGENKVKPLYPHDHTHFNAVGASLCAADVVSLLKGLRPSPITKFLSAKGKAVPADGYSWLQLPLPANPKLPTLFIIGDSTVRFDRGRGPNWGWGDMVGRYFDLNKINVDNRAIGGTSSRSYYTGEWKRVLDMMKPGDFVMMQFGHNDPGPLNDRRRARGTIRGVGDQSVAITNLLTGRPEVVHTYGWYIRHYITDARSKGATPIVCSQIPRKIWKNGTIEQSTNSYTGWAEEAAKAEHAPFVDLNKIIAERYDAMGPKKVNPLFGDAHTHTTMAGAELNARCVIAGLKALPDDPLAPYLLAGKL
jgi:lysophospholipase L1-like esterase